MILVCVGIVITALLCVVLWHRVHRIAGVTGAGAASQVSAPWPMFGGNAQRTGQSPFVTPVTARLQWRAATTDPILSSPVIGADGTIYITSGDGYLYAFRGDGTEKWKWYGVFSSYLDRGSPAIDADGTIYLQSNNQSYLSGYLYAIDPRGTLKWKYKTESPFNNSPVIDDDGMIIFGAGKYVYALRPNGQLVWRHGVRDSAGTPAIGNHGIIYVVSRFGPLYAMQSNGALVWINQQQYVGASNPSIGGEGVIYVGDPADLDAVRADGSDQWTLQMSQVNPLDSSSFSSNFMSCPTISQEGSIIVGAQDGNLYAIRQDGTVRWRFKVGSGSTSAISANGIVYIGSDDGYLYAIGLDGLLRWKYKTQGPVVSSPAIGRDGTVYVGSWDGYLYAFGK